MAHKHQFGKNGYFGLGEGPDAGATRKRRKKSEPAKQVNPARDNIPLSHPRYKQPSFA